MIDADNRDDVLRLIGRADRASRNREAEFDGRSLGNDLARTPSR